MSPKKVIVAYIPVLHQGYRKLLEDNPSFHNLYILDDSVLNTHRAIQKDIRRLHPAVVRQSLTTWNLLNHIEVADEQKLRSLNSSQYEILMPHEDISQLIANKYFPEATLTFSSVFLRWDRSSSNAKDPVVADIEISRDELHQTFLTQADNESKKSTDSWRRVGAALARDGTLIEIAHNHSLPTAHSSWLYGDPRNSFAKGTDGDKTSFIHAEASLIAHAARKGISLSGTDMYVTTFPCASCALLLAESGVKRIFFRDGYATLDGDSILKSKNIKIVRVVGMEKKVPAPENNVVAYPEK